MSSQEIITRENSGEVASVGGVIIPVAIARAGERATRRFLEFFAATIRNRNTREAYYRACCRFLAWCEDKGVTDLLDIEPLHVASYIEELGRDFAKPTVKQHLAAIRMLFDWLVSGGVGLIANPASPVRGPTHVVKRGKTPVLSADQTRDLIGAINVEILVGLRDRAMIALMTYTFARVSAAISMNVGDYFELKERPWVRLHEKGGKDHEMPVHPKLEEYLDAYLTAAGIKRGHKGPLFRSARGKSGQLTAHRLNRNDVFRMIRRRAKEASLSVAGSCHMFRATGITAYMENGGRLENAQHMAAHESPRTTKLYDRTADEITIEEVIKIGI
jgi:site-specific recombinase XerD